MSQSQRFIQTLNDRLNPMEPFVPRVKALSGSFATGSFRPQLVQQKPKDVEVIDRNRKSIIQRARKELTEQRAQKKAVAAAIRADAAASSRASSASVSARSRADSSASASASSAANSTVSSIALPPDTHTLQRVYGNDPTLLSMLTKNKDAVVPNTQDALAALRTPHPATFFRAGFAVRSPDPREVLARAAEEKDAQQAAERELLRRRRLIAEAKMLPKDKAPLNLITRGQSNFTDSIRQIETAEPDKLEDFMWGIFQQGALFRQAQREKVKLRAREIERVRREQLGLPPLEPTIEDQLDAEAEAKALAEEARAQAEVVARATSDVHAADEKRAPDGDEAHASALTHSQSVSVLPTQQLLQQQSQQQQQQQQQQQAPASDRSVKFADPPSNSERQLTKSASAANLN